jgi:hypothetical protein
MKSIIFLIIFQLIFLLEMSSQDYFPMLGETNEWNIVKAVDEGVETCLYYANEDTIIDNKKYKILRSDEIGVYYLDDFKLKHGYLREDTANRKIYIRSDSVLTGINKEFIYLDFSLNAGDSILLYNINWHSVDSLGYYKVDSLTIINTFLGERKALYLSGDPNYDYIDYYFWSCYYGGFPIWIEGVGSLSAPSYPHTKPLMDYDICQWSDNALSCFYKNGILVFQSEFSLDCGCIIFDHWGSIEDSNISEIVMIYPNPIKNELTIKNNSQISVLIEIIDLSGRICYTSDIAGLRDITVNISSLPSGLYIIQYICEDSKIGNEKIIKE